MIKVNFDAPECTFLAIISKSVKLFPPLSSTSYHIEVKWPQQVNHTIILYSILIEVRGSRTVYCFHLNDKLLGENSSDCLVDNFNPTNSSSTILPHNV